MSKLGALIIVIITLLVGGFLLFKSPASVPAPAPALVTEAQVKQNVEDYLRANIASLSPVEPVLGGSWYVVSVSVDTTKYTGTVVYEDGHIQEVKNFSYKLNDAGEVASLTIAPAENKSGDTDIR